MSKVLHKGNFLHKEVIQYNDKPTQYTQIYNRSNSIKLKLLRPSDKEAYMRKLLLHILVTILLLVLIWIYRIQITAFLIWICLKW
ncbi:MAG: hypothetical protein BWY21_02080 [Parcubacteria group bacterium ADurb.Bin216]|nr:MAG: hypothetical protein BWY21_02080 [Parcubacteria group bacterium ADurb.Bin216]